MGVGRYELLKNRQGNLIDIPDVSVSIPILTDKDYFKGYVVRYFVQKANDINSVIYEVSKSNYTQILSSPIYLNLKLDWRIIGDPIEIKKSNTSSLRIASETIPKISLYLPNLLQFYKK